MNVSFALKSLFCFVYFTGTEWSAMVDIACHVMFSLIVFCLFLAEKWQIRICVPLHLCHHAVPWASVQAVECMIPDWLLLTLCEMLMRGEVYETNYILEKIYFHLLSTENIGWTSGYLVSFCKDWVN